MSKSHKIKALLSMKGIKSSEYSEALGLARQQALTNKYSRESFTSDDLIQLAELTNTQLTFVDKDTGKALVSFDVDDIKTESKDDNK